MFAVSYGTVMKNMLIQCGHGNESEQAETKSGTGYEPVPLRFPVVGVQASEHHDLEAV